MEKVWCWGTGEIAENVMSYANTLGVYEILGFIDNDISKQGRSFWGKLVVPPKILQKSIYIYDKIIVLAAHYDEIKKQIENMKLPSAPIVENANYFYKQSILRRYEDSYDEEILKITEYIKRRDLQVFNYDFTDKYNSRDVDPVYDEECSMYYIMHGNKRLYFARYLDTVEKVSIYYRSILMEQDVDSPHRYLNEETVVNDGDVVVDAGVAEGNFAIEVIDKVSKIYLIEANPQWIEALKQTFRNYNDKVKIIPKYLTCINEGIYASLDRVIPEPVNFIKMDIEGDECDALIGAKRVFEESDRLQCAICSYHNDYDEIVIKKILSDYGCNCTHTNGYMWFPCLGKKRYISTKLCRAIVQAKKR